MDMKLEVVVVPVSELTGHGAEVSEVFHDAGGVFHHSGPRDGQAARLRAPQSRQ